MQQALDEGKVALRAQVSSKKRYRASHQVRQQTRLGGWETGTGRGPRALGRAGRACVDMSQDSPGRTGRGQGELPRAPDPPRILLRGQRRSPSTGLCLRPAPGGSCPSEFFPSPSGVHLGSTLITCQMLMTSWLGGYFQRHT